MSFDLDLTDHRALVTGGTRGVGAAVVDVLRVAGAKVIATARTVPADAIEGVHYIAADLATPPRTRSTSSRRHLALQSSSVRRSLRAGQSMLM